MNNNNTLWDAIQEIIRSCQVMITESVKKTTKVYDGLIVSNAGDKQWNVRYNGENHTVKQYGTVSYLQGSSVKVFVPQGNQNLAFIMDEASGSGGGGGDVGPPGPPGPTGPQGPQGEDGTTFTPSVSANGVISWTNDGGKTNPTPVNIKGPQGNEGPQGPQGLQGQKGEQGEKGETGAQGPIGPVGAQGPAGPGVPIGGVAGQVLAKKTGSNYDTEWVDQSGGSSLDNVVTTDNGGVIDMEEIIGPGPYTIEFTRQETSNIYLPLSGGTLTGALIAPEIEISGNSAGSIHILPATIELVDNDILTFDNITGTETNVILRGIQAPMNDNDAATKSYVDIQITGALNDSY